MKYCNKHGKQRPIYTYCPFCGKKLTDVIPENFNSEFILEKVLQGNDKIENMAFEEVRAASWAIIAVCAPTCHRLAEHSILPEELKNILKNHTVEYIGKRLRPIIMQFDDEDFIKFDKHYEMLKQKDSWVWKFANWFYSLPDGCCNGKFEIMRSYFKNNHLEVS